MYQKINEIVQDIENEIDILKTINETIHHSSELELFIKRLKYNIEEIKKLAKGEIK